MSSSSNPTDLSERRLNGEPPLWRGLLAALTIALALSPVAWRLIFANRADTTRGDAMRRGVPTRTALLTRDEFTKSTKPPFHSDVFTILFDRPRSLPLTTVAVLSFIGHWDDFVGPLIYLNRLENYTVSLALRLFQDQNGTEFNLLMAAALVHIVPVVFIFFFMQKHFVRGIAMSGLKG